MTRLCLNTGRLQDFKAAGPWTGLVMEVFKYAILNDDPTNPSPLTAIVLYISNLSLEYGHAPEPFQHSQVIIIGKSGDTTLCDNNRGISGTLGAPCKTLTRTNKRPRRHEG
jgi:hypothetical protein